MATITVSLPTDDSTAEVADYNTPITTIVNAINGGLDSNNLADNAVTTAKITDANVTTAKIADANVTMPKISNPYKFRVYRNAAYTGIADATLTLIDFDAESYDLNNNFDLTTNTYTIPVTGYYQFNAQIKIGGTAIVGAGIYLYGGAAGTTQLITTITSIPSSTEYRSIITDNILCTAGDLITLKIYADVTGTASILHGTDVSNFSGYLTSV